MTHPQGGFYSSLDADSEGQEGKFYIWDWDEIQALDWEENDKDWLVAAYGIREAGNFEGSNVLQRALDDEALAAKFGVDPEAVPAKLGALHARLLDIRAGRVRPHTDDKVLTAWNGWMLVTFAEAARYLQNETYLDAARANASFLLEEMFVEGVLQRSWRAGQANHAAYLEDHASLILGLLALYQSDPDPHWYARAAALMEETLAHFRDPAGGFFDTRDDHEALILRPKDIQDNATPSGNALAAQALLQLAAYSGNGGWRGRAEEMLRQIQKVAVRYPTGFGQWLCALDFALAPVQEVAILGDPDSLEFQALAATLWARYRPHLVAALSNFPPEPQGPALLADRPLIDQKPTAYVCQHFTCQYPVTTPEALNQQLENPA
jgi:uncharacterized protein YyaL (SSP411 family)